MTSELNGLSDVAARNAERSESSSSSRESPPPGPPSRAAQRNQAPPPTQAPPRKLTPPAKDGVGTVVRMNKVAPVVIKSCREEYQKHDESERGEIVYGRLDARHPQHALVLVSLLPATRSTPSSS